MNKTIVIGLAVVVFFIYQQIDSDVPNDTQSGWLEFLEFVGANIAGDLFFKGLYKLTKAGIARLRAKGATTAAEKVAAKEAEALAEKEGLTVAEKEAATIAEKEAERIAEAEAEKAAEKAAMSAGEKSAEEAAADIARREAMTEAEIAAEKEAEKAGESSAMKEADRLAEQEAERIAEAQAEKAAEREAERVAEIAAEKALEKTAENVALKEAEVVAERLAARTATMGAKVSGMMAQLMEGPWGWALLAIETALYAGLGLDPSMFKPCPSGELDLGALPAWAQGLISAIPILGDLFTLIGGLLCFRESCPEGMENSGGLCYSPCKENFKSDGATLCYKQYGDYWENKGFPAQATLTSITKTILTNTGVPYSECGEGLEKDGALCYEPCRPGYVGVGPVCWARIDTVGNGVGNIPDKGGCDGGQRDDGTSCWEDWKAHCRLTGLSLVDDSCFYGCGCIKKTLFDRQYCSNPNQEKIGALCYDKCPPGMSHPPGMPNQCRTDGELSYGRGAGNVMKCGKGQSEDSLGLCYNDPPSGFRKSTLGMMEDILPEGTIDFGVGGMRESYNRGAGKVGLAIYLKSRESYYGKDVGPGYFPGTG